MHTDISWLPWFKRPPELSKEGRFPVAVLVHNQHRIGGFGTRISEIGLTFVLDFPLPTKVWDLEITIREHTFPVRVTIKSMESAGRHTTYRAKYVGIKADDWDRIVRYVRDIPDCEHIGSYFDPTVPDDDYRLLPLAIQQEIVATLVANNRLIEPQEGSAPLLRMKKISESRLKNGDITRKIGIHSRVVTSDDVYKDSDSIFVIDSNGKVEFVS